METFSALLAFIRGIHRWPVNSPHKGQWCRALMFSMICDWTNSRANNGDAGDLRRHCAHYDVIVMWGDGSYISDAEVYFVLETIYGFIIPQKAHIWRSERTRKHLPEYPDWDIMDAVPSAPSDALAIAMTSQWARWLLKSPASRLFTESFSQAQIKETSKLRVTGLCEGNSPVTGEFPAQTAINAVNVSIWWRHHTVLENLINWLIITHRHSVTEKQARVVK